MRYSLVLLSDIVHEIGVWHLKSIKGCPVTPIVRCTGTLVDTIFHRDLRITLGT